MGKPTALPALTGGQFVLFSALGVVNQQPHGISVSQERGTSDPASLKLARILDEPAARPFKAFDK